MYIGHGHILVTGIYWSRTCIGHGHVLFTDIYWSRTCTGHGHVLFEPNAPNSMHI